MTGATPQTAATGVPLTLPTELFDSYLGASSASIGRQDLSTAYHNLDLALDEAATLRLTPTAWLVRFLDVCDRFQRCLIQNQDHDGIKQYLCPNEQGLLGRLIRDHGKDPDSARQLISIIWAGARQMPDHPEWLTVKIAFLERAYRLAKIHALIGEQKELLPILGESYLALAGTLSPEKCYSDGYRQAAICFNIALELAPDQPGIHLGLSRTETALLSRLSSLDHVVAKMETEIWSERNPIPLPAALDIAELMIEAGEVAIASAIYAHLIKRSRRKPHPHGPSLQQRMIDISTATHPTPLDHHWKTNRARLASARATTSYLIDWYLGPRKLQQPKVDRSHEGLLLELLIEYQLVPSETGDLEEFPSKLTKADVSVHQIQAIHNQLMIDYCKQLYDLAVRLTGLPPCKYSLIGLGSMARGEMTLYSDLDAVVVVENRHPKTLDYFKRVGHLFELMVINLGETTCEFTRMKHLPDRFCLDAAILHPTRTIETADRLVRHRPVEAASLRTGHDVDPIRNALRLCCLVTGDEEPYQQYRAALDRSLTSRETTSYGESLMARWIPPPPREPAFDAKAELYRPISLLIDALGLFHGITEPNTLRRLEALESFVPADFIALCRRALELACRLRLRAQAFHGEEQERVYTYPSSPSSLSLSYRELIMLRTIDHLLFKPLSQMTLSKGIDPLIWKEAKATFLSELDLRGCLQEVQILLHSLDATPIDLQTNCALWEGEYAQAAALHRKMLDLPSTDDRSFYLAVTHHISHLPPSRALYRLAARLCLADRRSSLPNPPTTLFSGPLIHRQQACAGYLLSLLKLRIPDELRAPLWGYAEQCSQNAGALPQSEQELYTQVTRINGAGPSELLHADLIYALRDLLAQDPAHTALPLLYPLFPIQLRQRVIDELSGGDCPASLIQTCRRYPLPDGLRPLWVPPQSDWQSRELEGTSHVRIQTIQGPSTCLSSQAVSFFDRLLQHKPQKYGRHSVGEFQGYHFKLDPEAPGRGFASDLLRRLVAGESFPTQQLAKLGVGSSARAVTVSKTVQGETLQTFLEKAPQIKNLYFRRYCFDVLVTILIRYEDAKPDNLVIFQSQEQDGYQLADVDPERAFYGDIIRSGIPIIGRDTLQLKSILLCLDQMREKIDPDVRREFLALHPAAVLERWLRAMNTYNQSAIKLFGETFVDRALAGKTPTVIPFFVQPSFPTDQRSTQQQGGLLIGLYRRFTALQAALRSAPEITLMELLCYIMPEVGALYAAQFSKHESALQRFCELTAKEYTRPRGTSLSITTSKLKDPHRSIKGYHQADWTIASALEDLKRIVTSRSTQQSLLQALLAGDASQLKALNIPDISNAVVRQIDFSRLSPRKQTAVLQSLRGLEFTDLRIKGCRSLSDRILRDLLSHSPRLRILDLTHSSGCVDPSFIQDLCPMLQKLYLGNHPTLQTLASSSWAGREETLTLPSLQSLDISHCNQLQSLRLDCPNLRHLRWHGEIYPNPFEIQAPNLHSIHVEKRSLLFRLVPKCKPKEIRFGPARINAQPDIKLESLTCVTAIVRHEDLLILQQGASDSMELVEMVSHLGFSRFTVETREADQPVRFTVVPYEPEEHSLERITRLLSSNAKVRQLDLSHWSSELTDAKLTGILALTPHLSRLILAGCRQLTQESIDRISGFCPSLGHLDLSGWDYLGAKEEVELHHSLPTVDTLILKGCSSLRDEDVAHLSERFRWMSSVNLANTNLGPAAVQSLLANCTELTSLDLRGIRADWDPVLDQLARHTGLSSLHLPFDYGKPEMPVNFQTSQLEKLTLYEWNHPTVIPTLGRLARHAAHLRELDLTYCTPVHGRLLRKLAQGCPVLTALNLNHCSQIDSSDFNASLPSWTSLSRLNLSYCKGLNEGSILAVAAHCGRLRDLTLIGWESGLTTRSLAALGEGCPALTALNVAYSITTIDLSPLVRQFPELRIMQLARVQGLPIGGMQGLGNRSIQSIAPWGHHLKYLGLECLDGLQSADVSAIIEACTQIQTLDLSWTKSLAEQTFLAASTPLPSLTALNLSYLAPQSDQFLQRVGTRCPNLRRLWIDNPDSDVYRDTTLIQLTRDCRQLREVHLNRCRFISDEAVMALSENCTALEALHLALNQVTDRSLVYLAQHSARLHTVVVSDLWNLTDATPFALAQRPLPLKFVSISDSYFITSSGIRLLEDRCSEFRHDDIWTLLFQRWELLERDSADGQHAARLLEIKESHPDIVNDLRANLEQLRNLNANLQSSDQPTSPEHESSPMQPRDKIRWWEDLLRTRRTELEMLLEHPEASLPSQRLNLLSLLEPGEPLPEHNPDHIDLAIREELRRSPYLGGRVKRALNALPAPPIPEPSESSESSEDSWTD